jgi:hypothetical protein
MIIYKKSKECLEDLKRFKLLKICYSILVKLSKKQQKGINNICKK